MTRRTLVSPAGRGTTEAFAFAFEPGAAPGTTPAGDGSPNRNRIAARALYDGSGNAIMDNGAPRAAQDVEYDLDGNAVRLPGKLRQTVGASWDALGRMTTFVEGDPKTELGAPAETYRYAADGFRWLRAGTDGRATLTLRDAQGRPLAEYVVARGASGPTLSREYVHALGQVVAERAWTGGTQTTTYHHRDHLGSLRVATDGAGALADAHDYYPFGGEMGPVASSSRKKFTGHERDEETGLDYMLARYYPGSMGRFLSVDPGFDVQPESPQSWNLYAYVRNNPVNATDPTGKWEWLDNLIRKVVNRLAPKSETSARDAAENYRLRREAGDSPEEAMYNSTRTTGVDASSVADGAREGMTRVGGGLAQAAAEAIIVKGVGELGEAVATELKLTDHAVERMAERGVSVGRVQQTVNVATPFEYFHEGVWKIGYYDPSTKTFVARVGEEIVTVMTDVTRDYVRGLKEVKP